MGIRFFVWSAIVFFSIQVDSRAVDILVTNEAEFATALSTAADGDRILLAPGTYNGGFSQSGLTGVTIRSQFTDNLAIISGGANAIQLSDATRVTLEYLICQAQTGNGLNIDDGGSFKTPSTEITIRDLTVRDMNASGNNDGIKLSGVTGFTISRVRVINWGEGGSAIDPVGCHHGLIENSFFRHDAIGVSGSGVRPKGGSKDITIRANRFELPGTNGRAIQAGGSTGSQFFRFIDGDSGYEADQIRVEGNVVLNGSSSFAFVNIDGGHFHHNYAWRPDDWFIRILNENQGNSIVDTKNGLLNDNVMVFNDAGTEFKSAVNIGGETEASTFMFLQNQWFNIANPANSEPVLPSPEINGIYGVPPEYGIDDAMGWQFQWGLWIVNANDGPKTFTVGDASEWLTALPGVDSSFDPLLVNPFLGDWTFYETLQASIPLLEWSEGYLVSANSRIEPGGQKFLDGVVDTGQLSDMFESDNQYQVVDPSPTKNLRKQKVEVILQSQTGVVVPQSFSFRLESKMVGGPAGDVIQRIWLWNDRDDVWELMDSRATLIVDELVQVDPLGDLSRFVQAGTGEVTAKIAWSSDSFSGKSFVWSIEIDEATWLVFD